MTRRSLSPCIHAHTNIHTHTEYLYNSAHPTSLHHIVPSCLCALHCHFAFVFTSFFSFARRKCSAVDLQRRESVWLTELSCSSFLLLTISSLFAGCHSTLFLSIPHLLLLLSRISLSALTFHTSVCLSPHSVNIYLRSAAQN